MAWSYYIYYRVDAAHQAAATAATRKILDAVFRDTEITGRLLKKRNEALLWMEIYEGVSDEAKFEWALAEAVAGSGIAAPLQQGSTRHIECFSE